MTTTPRSIAFPFFFSFAVIFAATLGAVAQGSPVRLELKPFPPPADGVIRCKPNDELQIQLVGYDAKRLETSLNQYRPIARSSNANAVKAEVPANTGQQVRATCRAAGRATITASYDRASASIEVEVQEVLTGQPTLGQGGITAQPAPSPSPGPTITYPYDLYQKTINFTDDQPSATVTVACPAGRTLVTGGANIVSNGNVAVGYALTASNPVLFPTWNGWSAIATRMPGYTPVGLVHAFTAQVLCSK